MSKQYTLSIIQFPSGRFGFVGSVPKDLAIRHRDNRTLSDAEFTEYSRASNPAMIMRANNYVEPVFNTRDEALAFVRDHLDILEQSDKFGCFDGFGRRDQNNTREFFNRPEIKAMVQLLETKGTENE